MKHFRCKLMLRAVLLLLTVQSCAVYYDRNNYKSINEVLHHKSTALSTPFLKAHLKNGYVCVFSNSWSTDSLHQHISGQASMYNVNRQKTASGLLSIAVDSVAIFETNTKVIYRQDSRIAALSIVGAMDVIAAIYCITNPKACFGSCPTFYLNEDDNFHYSDAEGFSNAIAPSMEYTDVDALPRSSGREEFSVYMRNEAMETHCINQVKLLAFRVQNNEHVYHGNQGDYYLCNGLIEPDVATAAEGNVLDLLSGPDRRERFSVSDPENLSSREQLILEFNGVKDALNTGLILHFRQSLMSTYFIYSALGYMGNEASDLIAGMETGTFDASPLKKGIKNELGDIEVYLWNADKGIWDFQDGFYETGPIAINRQFMALKNRSQSENIKIKLVFNKGLWRLDYAALSHIREKVKPIELLPEKVFNKGTEDKLALELLRDENRHLVSMPGGRYRLQYRLPQIGSYDLFLSSRGYYLEWLRQQWMDEKNMFKLRQMAHNPKAYLRSEARRYKAYERNMEEQFWGSKINTELF